MNFLDKFRDWKDIKEYPAGTVIYAEGDPAGLMYVVVEGEIEVTLHGESLGVEKEGGIFGEVAMVNSASRNATVTTLSRTRLAHLDRDQFRMLVSENAEFSFHVMAVLASRLRAVDKYISKQLEERR